MPRLRIDRTKPIFVLLMTLSFGVTASIAQQTPPAFRPGRTLVSKAVEGDDRELHVFPPGGRKPGERRPVIVFSLVEDGAETPAQFYPHSRYFALRGMVAISAQ